MHKDQEVRYTLSKEADTSSSQIPESQPDLNNNEKSELSVHTKGIEIIEHLTYALWINCNGKEVSKVM